MPPVIAIHQAHAFDRMISNARLDWETLGKNAAEIPNSHTIGKLSQYTASNYLILSAVGLFKYRAYGLSVNRGFKTTDQKVRSSSLFGRATLPCFNDDSLSFPNR